MIATIWVLVALSLAASAYTVVHLAHLPVAPACPECRSVTGHRLRITALDRLFGAFANAAARECPRCGWSGRMRWRLALRRTPAE